MNQKILDKPYETLRTKAFKIPNLEPNEFNELLLLAQTGNTEAINKIILSYLKYVFIYVEKHYDTKEKILKDSCIAEGYFSLYDAIKNYRPDKGASFATYAGYWIKKYVSQKFCKAAKINEKELNVSHIQNFETIYERKYCPSFEKNVELECELRFLKQQLIQDKKTTQRDCIIFDLMSQVALHGDGHFKRIYGARVLGISHQSVSVHVKKIGSILKNYKDN